MADKEVLGGNKLIAQFMGVKIGEDKYSYRPGVVMPLQESNLAYHESWGWLMPVMEKIWSLGGWEYCIFANGCTINGDHEQPPYISHTEGDTIKSTWLAVIDFINFYNQRLSQPSGSEPTAGELKRLKELLRQEFFTNARKVYGTEQWEEYCVNNNISYIDGIGSSRCQHELLVEQFFGLSESVTEKTEIKTDFGQLVNLVALASQPLQHQQDQLWIPVEKDLPDFDELVLWHREDGTMFIDEIDHDNDWHNFKETWETDQFAEYRIKITHWRKLPASPNSDKNAQASVATEGDQGTKG